MKTIQPFWLAGSAAAIFLSSPALTAQETHAEHDHEALAGSVSVVPT